jgi:hypothetical protein
MLMPRDGGGAYRAPLNYATDADEPRAPVDKSREISLQSRRKYAHACRLLACCQRRRAAAAIVAVFGRRPLAVDSTASGTEAAAGGRQSSSRLPVEAAVSYDYPVLQ